MPQSKHQPLRLCIGCRTSETTHNMVRLACVETNGTRSVVLDQAKTLPGRGAWLHHNPQCFEMAIRRKATNRAFKAAVDASVLTTQLQAMCDQATTTEKNQESGSEI